MKVLAVATLLLIFVFFPCYTRSEEPLQQRVMNGSQSYERGEYEKAVSWYEQAIAGNSLNGHLHYNIGNAYYRLGRIGRAIVSFRQAQLLLPRDPDIEANLNLARKQTVDKLKDEESGNVSSFLMSKALFLRSGFNRHELKWAFLSVYLLFWLCFTGQAFVERRLFQPLGVLSLALMLYLFFVTFFSTISPEGKLAFSSFSFNEKPGTVVVTVDRASAYSTNSDKVQVVFMVHDGAELQLGEMRGDWIQVILPNGRQGWVRANQVSVI